MKKLYVIVLMFFTAHLYAREENKPVVVAVIDSAINTSLNVFKDNITAGFNFIGSPPDHDDHGTAVAGIIIAIAPHVSLMPLGVTHNGTSTHEKVVNALVYAMNHGAEIINLSLGVTERALLSVKEKVGDERFGKSLFVLAAGNHPELFPPFSCDWPNVITVAALSLRDTCALTSYSAYGPHVDIAAPAGDSGDGLVTYSYFGQQRRFNGTSAAVPVVVGLAAVIKQENPFSDGAEMKQRVISRARLCAGAHVKAGRAINTSLLPRPLLQS